MGRSDGYRVKGEDIFYEFTPHIMVERTDATNFFEDEINYRILQKYINSCRSKGINMSYMSIIVAAFVRLISQNYKLNRFVSNKKIYARNHLCFCVAALSDAEGEKQETICKVYFNLDDDIFTVNDKIQEALRVAQAPNEQNAMDKFLSALVKAPGLVSGICNVGRFLDKHFGLPFSLVNISPFHASFFVTNLASLRIEPVFHHIYNFGTTSIFLAFGKPHKAIEVDDEKGILRRSITFRATTDDRVAEGYYYAKCFKELQSYLKNPSVLEQKPESVNVDPFVKGKKWIVK
ncbi:MAG: hypothetical protein MJ145_03115 [Clostridia bacterium]|nr:hypothetical protein [Clostridia bacterium]